MDSYGQGGMTYNGALFDFEDENEYTYGNVVWQYFRTLEYHISDYFILNVENDTIGEIVYLTNHLLKLKFHNDTAIFKPLEHKITLETNFYNEISSNSWKYQRKGHESRLDLFDNVIDTNYAPRECLRHNYNKFSNSVEIEGSGWTYTNYKDYLVLSVAISPATSEIYEITEIKKNSFTVNVLHKEFMESLFENYSNDLKFEDRFYDELKSVSIEKISKISEVDKSNLVDRLAEKVFNIISYEKSGKGAISKRFEVPENLFSEECLLNKSIGFSLLNDTITIKDCHGLEYSTKYEIARDGSFLIIRTVPYDNPDVIKILQNENSLSLNCNIRIKTGERTYDRYIVRIE